MKIFGYQKDSDKLLNLNEMTIQCDVNELDRMIIFLNEVKTKHSAIYGKTDMCHSHLRDMDLQWKNGDPDIIVVTKF